ncbi:ribonuclease VapC38 [Cellulomonas chitinilytica]|uniref:Ribonuclease VapC n=1 Tax=Cellulomonas chitinilytica TaxID=398759 RepID=A0A919U294_9CELL|nr:TA system VapC family ribonuclease toxin [Cellulomonas chitinilytica]GIG20904.1 ribonuclease VapC38 [Cellulomonas chitinilytica]
MTTTDPLWLLDVNVLMALAHPSHVHHGAAHAWFATVTAFATTALTETGLLRLSMNPAVTGQQISPSAALGLLSAIRALPAHRSVSDGASLAAPAIISTPAGYKQVTDLHLVNLAATSDAVLVTFDSRLANALHPDDRRHVHVLSPVAP